ncbi:MAG: hypothetical protein M1816_000179 [Peltula sp. TS41687]|nr:MAG: hypothetical protein M1816_000179 [Peltula sp. TS41687]
MTMDLLSNNDNTIQDRKTTTTATTTTTTKPAHLDPSPLGTQAYWDDIYLSELKSSISHNDADGGDDDTNDNSNRVQPLSRRNDTDDTADVAEASDADPDPDSDSDSASASEADDRSSSSTDWFSEHQATTKLVRYLTSPQLGLDKRTTSMLDLGSGNGALLSALRRQGAFSGPTMIGVDYSSASITLARRRQSAATKEVSRARSPPPPPLRFERWDIVREDVPDWLVEVGGFDVVLDKGTFDAVCLSGEERNAGEDGEGDDRVRRRACEVYPAKVARLVKPDTGRLVVTSCCWTAEELRRWFEDGDGDGDGDGHTRLKACDRIEYPSFVFGGRKGTCLACVVFYRPASTSEEAKENT